MEPEAEGEPGVREHQRNYVLLTVMAHVLKRVENAIYRKIFEAASQEDFYKLGLDEDYRKLLIGIMEVSAKSDPLYIRFLAFAQLSGKPPDNASVTALFLPGDKKPYTPRELFPHETQFLSKHLSDLAADSYKWEEKLGGETFKRYLNILSSMFAETDSNKAALLQKQLKELYTQVVADGFPLILTPPLDVGSVQQPYLDPELKVSIVTPETQEQDRQFLVVRDALADGLAKFGLEEIWRQNVKLQKLKSSIVLGGYGVNLNLSAVASESAGVTQLFYNEQLRTYDREFPDFLNTFISNTTTVFREMEAGARQGLMEQQSQTNTMLHEFSHAVYDENSKELERLGRKPGAIIDEVKAEILFPAIVPEMLKRGVLPGTPEQWAVGILGSKLQMFRDHTEGDAYYYAAVYALNRLFHNQVIAIESARVKILDFNKFYHSLYRAAREILVLYRDKSMTEKRAQQWVNRNCKGTWQMKSLKKLLTR